jgi:predicted nucleotidyltransferase
MAEVSLLEFARRTVAALRTLEADFAVVGGFAVSVRTEPRFTRDLDLAISLTSDAEAEALVKQMQALGYQAFAVVEQEETARMATVRLRMAGVAAEPLIVDLLFASSGVEQELVAAATPESIPGLGDVPVATSGFLIALKLLSGDEESRPKDLLDLKALLEAAALKDVEEAALACRLIQQRGFARGRDLPQLLEAQLRRHGK